MHIDKMMHFYAFFNINSSVLGNNDIRSNLISELWITLSYKYLKIYYLRVTKQNI